METGTPSLLLTLLTTDATYEYPITSEDIGSDTQENIRRVVEALKNKKSDLIKDVAQEKLYEALASIIDMGYEEPKDQAPQNSVFNRAIGQALENALKGNLKSGSNIKKLREKLREEIIAALTPK